MSKKRRHSTTKNTIAKPPVTRLNIIEGECNGPFKIITDFCSPQEQAEFDKLYRRWFDSPDTGIWIIEGFINYFKLIYPRRVCMLYSDYLSITRGKVIPATKEEWQTENN